MSQNPRKRFRVEDVITAVIDSDEDLDGSENSDDFESESSSEDDDDFSVTVKENISPNVENTEFVWSKNTDNLRQKEFVPSNVGPVNIPEHLCETSKPAEFLNLFWNDELWECFVNFTNKQAEHFIAERPTSYY